MPADSLSKQRKNKENHWNWGNNSVVAVLFVCGKMRRAKSEESFRFICHMGEGSHLKESDLFAK